MTHGRHSQGLPGQAGWASTRGSREQGAGVNCGGIGRNASVDGEDWAEEQQARVWPQTGAQ